MRWRARLCWRTEGNQVGSCSLSYWIIICWWPMPMRQGLHASLWGFWFSWWWGLYQWSVFELGLIYFEFWFLRWALRSEVSFRDGLRRQRREIIFLRSPLKARMDDGAPAGSLCMDSVSLLRWKFYSQGYCLIPLDCKMLGLNEFRVFRFKHLGFNLRILKVEMTGVWM